MNSYNENLQNTVSAALQSQNLELKNLQSQYNSSMFTLYYAEGATVTADEKLGIAEKDLGSKSKVKTQAVKCASISANQQSSSIQANQYIGQSVSNAAICASNVQAASTAVTRLAGDIGSIYSIVNAADFDTDIYVLTDELNNLINKTAYAAELTSEIAMDASTFTSEISAGTVMSDAKTTNGLMNNLLKIVSADFDAASQTVNADNATLAAASTTEKAAEGAFESAGIDNIAGQVAYDSINIGLNLGLTSYSISKDNFWVLFEPIKSPFPVTGQTNALYPVSEYYIIVVKNTKKLIFSISDAENLKLNGKNQYVQVSSAIPPTSEIAGNIFPDMISEFIDYEKVSGADGSTYALHDSDGDPVQPGVNYVVFVMAIYSDAYKRKINNFDDFLSAPSQSFCMTTLLDAADDNYLYWQSGNLSSQSFASTKLGAKMNADGIELSEIASKYITDDSKAKQFLLFYAKQDADLGVDVSYECMFLPATKISNGLITKPSYRTFIQQELKLEKISDGIDVKIAELQAEQKKLKKQETEAANDPDKLSELKQLHKDITKYLKQLTGRKDELASQNANQAKLAFFFNKALAEKVSAGNYTTASQIMWPENKATDFWIVFIDPATTDNFGNPLIGNASYIPAFLSAASSDDEQTLSQFTSNISAFDKTTSFTYINQL